MEVVCCEVLCSERFDIVGGESVEADNIDFVQCWSQRRFVLRGMCECGVVGVGRLCESSRLIRVLWSVSEVIISKASSPSYSAHCVGLKSCLFGVQPQVDVDVDIHVVIVR